MELLFGTVGGSETQKFIFEQLTTASLESNPGLQLQYVAGERVMLGGAFRAFHSWSEQDGGLRLYLDGEILYLNGAPTQHLGTTADELASVAKLYRRHGERIWEHLDGNFCLIIEDGQTVSIGVDLAGNRTLYYWLHEGVLAFHSYLLDLAPIYPGDLTEDFGTIANVLMCGSNLPGRTAFNEIQHLSPGCYLKFADGKVRSTEHFRLEFQPEFEGIGKEQLIDELNARLSASIKVGWRAAKNPVLPLSGGADSRYVVAEIARQVEDKQRLHTITWGMNPSKAGSDAIVAKQVAAVLGVENVWYEKRQDHLETEFERAIYLTSGEADIAIHYPDDSLLDRLLVQQHNFASMFRGETVFRRYLPLFTNRAVLAENDMSRMGLDTTYQELIDADIVQRLSEMHNSAMAALLAGLRSPTPTGRRDELYYSFRIRQILGTYNKARNAYLEVYNPLISRNVLEWIRRVPDHARIKRFLFLEAMSRAFPEVAHIPLATTSNLPPWRTRFRTEPKLSQFYRTWCEKPGWLDSLGNKQRVLQSLAAMEETAQVPQSTPSTQDGSRWKKLAKDTLPGRLLREMTLEKRFAASLPRYLMLARLAVLHGLLGRIYERKPAFQTASMLHENR